MRSSARVACVQMNSTDDVAHNLSVAESFIQQAAQQGASLVLLPENVAFMGRCMSEQREHAETLNDASGVVSKKSKNIIQNSLCAWAAQYGIWVVAGSVPIQQDKQIYAASLVFNQRGERVAHYFKIHLFDVTINASKTTAVNQQPSNEQYQESSVFTSGSQVTVVDAPVGRLGLSICYDVRFPELYRDMVAQGAQLFCVPAAFTRATGQAHWHTLLKARAIENLSYVLAAGQAGTHPSGRHTYGHSTIINPWGETLAASVSSEQPELIVADIELGAQQNLREQFPALSHRVLPI